MSPLNNPKREAKALDLYYPDKDDTSQPTNSYFLGMISGLMLGVMFCIFASLYYAAQVTPCLY